MNIVILPQATVAFGPSDIADIVTNAYKTKKAHKSFQLNVEVDPTQLAAAQAAAQAAALTAKVRIDVSNDGVYWHTLCAEKTLVKGAGAAGVSDFWPALEEMWAFVMAVPTQVDAGLQVTVFMAMED